MCNPFLKDLKVPRDLRILKVLSSYFFLTSTSSTMPYSLASSAVIQ